MEVVRLGVWPVVSDGYNFLMRTSFINLSLVLLGAWLGISVLFAAAFYAMPMGSLQAEADELTTFWDIFFVSSCVMSDVEIGARPVSVPARLLYLFEVSTSHVQQAQRFNWMIYRRESYSSFGFPLSLASSSTALPDLGLGCNFQTRL